MKYNPYDILGISHTASKLEITKAVAEAIKHKKYPVDLIAKAQKILMRAEERIIADYLRPVLPTIQQFEYSDLSALTAELPTLTLLSEFDGLEQAINQETQQKNLDAETTAISATNLLKLGIRACKEKCYSKAIKYLEDYCENSQERISYRYIQAQMWLIKAYRKQGQLQRAIALCEILSYYTSPKVNTWAKKILVILYKESSRA